MKSINIDWEALGAQFAHMEDNTQALFFKGLARELKTWETHYHKELQFAYVSRLLKPEEKEELEVLGMLWFKDEEDF